MILAALAIYEAAIQMRENRLRREYFAKAEAVADRLGLPLLVVGNPRGRHGCGDVTVDIEPEGRCPIELRADVRDLRLFRDKQFGAAFCSHVLEHLPTSWDVERAISELGRVAYYAAILYPTPLSIVGRLHPGHSPESLRYLWSLSREGVIEIWNWEG